MQADVHAFGCLYYAVSYLSPFTCLLVNCLDIF